MCGTVFGIIGGVLAAKALLRWRWRRHGGGSVCRRGGGECGPGSGGGGWRGRWRRQYTTPGATVVPSVTLADIVRGLELNERQAADFHEVLATVPRDASLAPVLATIGEEVFARGVAESLLAGAPNAKDLTDGLEHLHNILTPEQREKLRGLSGTRV